MGETGTGEESGSATESIQKKNEMKSAMTDNSKKRESLKEASFRLNYFSQQSSTNEKKSNNLLDLLILRTSKKETGYRDDENKKDGNENRKDYNGNVAEGEPQREGKETIGELRKAYEKESGMNEEESGKNEEMGAEKIKKEMNKREEDPHIHNSFFFSYFVSLFRISSFLSGCFLFLWVNLVCFVAFIRLHFCFTLILYLIVKYDKWNEFNIISELESLHPSDIYVLICTGQYLDLYKYHVNTMRSF